MRLLILFLTLLSVAAGFTLQKTDGTVIEVGDEPMVIDGSDVIMPQDIFASASRVQLDGISEATDVSTADINPFPAAVHLYEGPYKQGRRAKAYLCATGMNGCLADGASEPWASSLTLQTCPHGSPVGNKTFACFFFSPFTCKLYENSKCQGNPSYSARESIANLATIGLDNKIKSVDCYFDTLHGE
ncbi:uncharacterized protein J4E87_000934 [Alternaria ethzedia]|uniref:uncharacterized protein n=1 Tax=Alternaria ethzedia TaxID=181014 RepID=UPI0020C493E5|nr:uncharacterized protein J4E87_000934 [Alternaria ethzedia]KAI4633768.1 hypothetical protein J4E87_000934 [Alternaria ethzedia]